MMHLHPTDPRYRAIQAEAAAMNAPGYWDEQPDANVETAPSRVGSPALDLGDKVADIIEARMGKAPASGYAPAMASPPNAAPARAKSTRNPDFGDLVADAYDRLRGKQVGQ